MDNSSKILIVCDFSNLSYVTIYNALNRWEKDYGDEASFLRDKWHTDQDNLPNLTRYESFCRELKKSLINKLESVYWVAKNNHQNEVDMCSDIDIVFAEDDSLYNNFRKKKYPEYKSQRKLARQRIDFSACKRFIRNVLVKELNLESQYRFIKVDNCESDDIIAILMKHYKDYMVRILLSSDRDFLQLSDVYQYDFWGKRITRHLKFMDENDEPDAKDFLLWKILRGDLSDNIKSVFNRFGDKKSYLLMRNREELSRMLKEDNEAAKRFLLNKELIDFRSIPSDIENSIIEKLNESMGNNSVKYIRPGGKTFNGVDTSNEEFDINDCI